MGCKSLLCSKQFHNGNLNRLNGAILNMGRDLGRLVRKTNGWNRACFVVLIVNRLAASRDGLDTIENRNVPLASAHSGSSWE